MTSQEQAEIEELMEFSQRPGPSKTWEQVLEDNPHCKGTLVETLASEEKAARLRSIVNQVER